MMIEEDGSYCCSEDFREEFTNLLPIGTDGICLAQGVISFSFSPWCLTGFCEQIRGIANNLLNGIP